MPTPQTQARSLTQRQIDVLWACRGGWVTRKQVAHRLDRVQSAEGISRTLASLRPHGLVASARTGSPVTYCLTTAGEAAPQSSTPTGVAGTT